MTKTIIITGATGELGQVLCEHLAKKKDYRLILTARNLKTLEVLTNKLQDNSSATITCVPSDFCNPESYKDLIELTTNGIDGIVIMPPRPPIRSTSFPSKDEWHQTFDHGFYGPLRLIEELMPALKINKPSRVILISGASSVEPIPDLATFNVLRTAWLGEMKTLADRYGPEGVCFNTVSLSQILTNTYLDKVRQEAANRNMLFSHVLEEKTLHAPLRHFPSLMSVAKNISFWLKSKGSEDMTGQNIVLDSGIGRRYS